ncbi:MAG: tetratricopeptide repeat protein [Luteolibacter sp.]
MKTKSLALLLLLAVMPIQAQEDASKNSDVDSLLPAPKEFLNMPADDRKKFVEHFGEASRYFQQKRIFECLDELHEAEKIFSDSAELLNLRGSCYVEMRAFDKAMVAFRKALEFNPRNTSVKFNIAEVLFVTKQWQESHDLFEQILREVPEQNTSLTRLVEFKMLLCKKKLGRNDEALILAEKYDFLDDSPFYYYAKAAIAYDEDDLLEAEQWLARANRIFQDPNIISPWQDTLVEFGYIKSFYGDDEPPAVVP